MGGQLTAAFIGNPNCGKTTLFNAYTGANLKVANWPGVTVERVEGIWKDKGRNVRLVDLPGTYSLTSYTMEEQVSRQFILSDEVDVIVDVVDASALERNLCLTLQLLELGRPVVVALNMMDIVAKRGMELDLPRLRERLGVPVIPICGRKRTGLGELMRTAVRCGERGEAPDGCQMVYDELLEFRIEAVETALHRKWPELGDPRWYAVKLLTGDQEITGRYPVHLPGILDEGCETEILNQKYSLIEEIVGEVLVHREERAAITEKADRLLTHSLWGLPIFLSIMAVVFFLTFAVGDMFKATFEQLIGHLTALSADVLAGWGVGELLTALITDGVIAGVGGILTFLPNICILFLALAFLEDTGYMARVAYLMDGIMGKLGLSGRAFLPMVLGFGCSVPAIMASRVLEERRDRLKTMLVTPFMSCSARLPVYVLFSGMFFERYAVAAAYSMYLIGIAAALLTAYGARLLERGRGAAPNDLLIELPEYKMPSGRTVAVYVWEKGKDYLTKAGSVIFLSSVLFWLLLNFGPNGYAAVMEESFAALLGKALVPLLAPAGLGFWPIAVALIAGISAKEVVVSSTAILFGVSSINSPGGMAAAAAGLSTMGFGPLNAYCVMVFCLLYIPCAATIGVIRRESGSWKWTGFSILFQLGTAWGVSALIYQVGRLIR